MHDPGNVAETQTDKGGDGSGARRREAALAGHSGDEGAARRALDDDDAGVRATALVALNRAGRIRLADLRAALIDTSARTRRSACEIAARSGEAGPGVAEAVLERLGDEDAGVVEVAAWALGELSEHMTLPTSALTRLASIATGHQDPLVRESAVAALGAIGDPEGLPAILAGTADKPAVRRRAVLALAPFGGPEVDAALARASTDRDWQVRDAAELLLRED